MKDWCLGLKFAFSYFTILPVTFSDEDDLSTNTVLSAMLFSLPLVGLVLGVLTIMLFGILEPLEWYGAIIVAIFYMVLYGFLHTEAVIDVADALYAEHSGKDAYTIIKEPTVGAMGVLFAMATMLLKVVGIVYLLLYGFLWEFVAVLIISRMALLPLFKLYQFRSDFATKLKDSLTLSHITGSFLLFSLVGTILYPPFILLLLAGLTLALLISFGIKRKIGFVNGDVLGSTLEGVEIILFMAVALWL